MSNKSGSASMPIHEPRNELVHTFTKEFLREELVDWAKD